MNARVVIVAGAFEDAQRLAGELDLASGEWQLATDRHGLTFNDPKSRIVWDAESMLIVPEARRAMLWEDCVDTGVMVQHIGVGDER